MEIVHKLTFFCHCFFFCHYSKEHSNELTRTRKAHTGDPMKHFMHALPTSLYTRLFGNKYTFLH